jgi:hypothetical protein
MQIKSLITEKMVITLLRYVEILYHITPISCICQADK